MEYSCGANRNLTEKCCQGVSKYLGRLKSAILRGSLIKRLLQMCGQGVGKCKHREPLGQALPRS